MARKFRIRRKRGRKKVGKAVKKYVKRTLDLIREDKYFDLSQTIASGTVATDNAGSVVLLSGVQAGTTFATRIGEVISAKSISWTIDVQAFKSVYATAADVFVTNLRVIVFQDMEIRSSTLPTVADVLETVAYNSPFNHIGVNARRFKILWDKLYELGPYIGTVGATLLSNMITRDSIKKRKLKGKIVYTNSSTGTQKGNIYVLFLSDQATAKAPAVNMYSRLLFEDA